ncbi:unnamed protein product, partial [Ectocarpus sp. 12 AP-2014]
DSQRCSAAQSTFEARVLGPLIFLLSGRRRGCVLALVFEHAWFCTRPSLRGGKAFSLHGVVSFWVLPVHLHRSTPGI